MFYNLKMNALACLFLMTGSAIQAAENIPPSQAADKDGSFISKTRNSIPPFPVQRGLAPYGDRLDMSGDCRWAACDGVAAWASALSRSTLA